MQVLSHVDDAFLPYFARVPAWDGTLRLGRIRYFEDAAQRLAIRVQVEAAISNVTIHAYRYEHRPAGQADPFTGPTPVGHSFTYADEAALTRKLAIIAKNLGALRHLAGAAYWHAYDAGDDERADCRRQLPAMIRAAILTLDPDLDQQVVLELGIRFRLVKVDGYASAHGLVPPFTRVVLEREDQRREVPANLLPGPPVTIDVPPSESIVSRVELAALLREHLARGVDELAARRPWELAPGLVLTPAWTLEPSRDLVVEINRRRPSTAPFATFVESLPDDAWRAVYDRVAAPADALVLLHDQVARTPGELKGYLELAKAYEARGDQGRAQLWLGLGYLRAKKLKTIARGKLEAARAAAPDLAELAAAFAELER